MPILRAVSGIIGLTNQSLFYIDYHFSSIKYPIVGIYVEMWLKAELFYRQTW